MVAFVLFSRRSGLAPGDAADAATIFRRQLAPLFSDTLPEASVRRCGDACLVSVTIPVKGWRGPLEQADERTWVLAVNVPVGAPGGPEGLPRLARRIQDDPDRLVRELAPPYTLVWQDLATGGLHIQTDGLGLAPLYRFDDGDLWAVSNRVLTLQAAGCPLAPAPLDWAVRLTVGWFPMDLTGFRGVRTVPPGTGARLDGRTVASHRVAALDDWLRPEQDTEDETWFERSRLRMLEEIRTAFDGWSGTSQVGLTGGRDSRAVASCLLALGIPVEGYVHGLPSHPDVRVASLLADAAGIALRHDTTAGMPPDDLASARRSIELALRWQTGARGAHKHKTFLPGGRLLGGGRIEISGQHGEIGRTTARVGGRTVSPDDRLIGPFLDLIPRAVRPSLVPEVEDAIHAMCHQIDRFALDAKRRWDFFFLYERTRRRSAGAHAGKTGIVFAPFMTPDYIRASFAVDPAVKRAAPFHSHFVARNFPRWSDVPYGESLPPWSAAETEGAAWRTVDGSRSYDTVSWWHEAGAELIDEALTGGGFWTEVLDPTVVAISRDEVPDEVALLHLWPIALGLPAPPVGP